jgi:hypothetical protein
MDARSGAQPDVDPLDPPIERVGQRLDPGAEGPPLVVRAGAGTSEQVAQRGARWSAGGGRRGEQNLTGSVRR